MIDLSYIILGTIIVLVIIAVIIIIYNKGNNPLYNTTPTLINPTTQIVPQDCKQVKTACDPADPNSCAKACNNTELLSCVKLGDSSHATDLTGGGYACLPAPVDIVCDPSKGGILVWTGYGLTDTAAWACYCAAPDIYNGAGCLYKNPDFCAGGKVDTTKLNTNSLPNADICNCPTGTVKLFRYQNNVPFCASTNPADGGGNYAGLAGNIKDHPNWENVWLRIQNETTLNWSKRIVIEATNGLDNTSINNIANNIATNVLNSSTLTLSSALANGICAIISQTASPCSSLCGKNGLNANIPDIKPVEIYTYYSGDLPPYNYC